MAVSTTAKKRHKKFNKKIYEKATKLATDEAVEQVLLGYLSIWSTKELNRICAVHDFVCVPLGKDHYRVGRFDLEKQPNGYWLVSDCDGYAQHEFGNQQAAVFFCLYETRHLYARAREFKDCDNELSKTRQEVNYLREKLRRASLKKDNFGIDLFQARLSNMLPKLLVCETNLQKTLISAKYSKVWETKS
jgi:hypothetical protein